MSWLFSQVLVEEYLGDTSLDGEQSVQSSGNPTPQAYCAPDKMTDFSRLSRFGMTYKPLTDDLGEELLMSYLAAFHAKTSLPQEREQGSRESEAECGEKWRGSFTKYDPNSFSWKTHQCSLLGDLDKFSETWPKWGLMRNGECWELPMLAHHTSEIESGSLLPTPLKSDWKGANKNSSFDSRNRQYIAWDDGSGAGTLYPNPLAYEALMGWPLGWTDLKPLETDKFQKWQDEHGRC